MREAIPAEVKLAGTYTDSQYEFRISKSTYSLFVPKVCDALYRRLKEKYLKVKYIDSFLSNIRIYTNT